MHLTIAFSVTFLVLVLLLKTRLVNIALDQPNHRSLHDKVTPRTGGLAIIAGLIAAWIFIDQSGIWIVTLMALTCISLLDDVRSLPVCWRLITQLVISVVFISILWPGNAWWLVVVLTLVITWMINLYNFMDGSDGLAGGMALFGFSAYAFAAFFANDMQLALMCGCVVSASAAFLLFNFHPARIFLGDAGSVPLGFLAGAIGLYGWKNELWPVWFPLLAFSPFIVDASITLLKRFLQGEKIWQAHRTHYYQRLIQLGWGHRKTAFAEYGLMAIAGGSAIGLIEQPIFIVAIALLIWSAFYFIILRWIDRQWARQAR